MAGAAVTALATSAATSAATVIAVVVGADEQTDVVVDVDRWCRLATAVLTTEGARGELTLTFVDRDEIAALNVEHLGHDGPTDVLSFPLDSIDGRHARPPPPGVPVLLGDVVVCPAVAADQAADARRHARRRAGPARRPRRAARARPRPRRARRSGRHAGA